MKRSAINRDCRDALALFQQHHWALPPGPRWDITGCSSGNFVGNPLTLINLVSERGPLPGIAEDEPANHQLISEA